MGFLLKKVKPACFLVMFSFFLQNLKGAPIDSATASAVALCFYSQSFNAKNITLSLAYTERSEGAKAIYYIYNANDSNGFVIVAAEDAAYPILGYSQTGHYNPGKEPPEFTYWMQTYKKQILYIRANKLKPTPDIQTEWNAYKNNLPLPNYDRITGSVNPLLRTFWAQSPYFNATCPGSPQCVAGCIATAMAQIMKYWAYPPHGIDTNSYDDPPYGKLFADFDTSHYNWINMPNSVSSNNLPVAVLSYDCGVSVNMEYTSNASSATMIAADYRYCSQNAYVKYFGYDGSTIQGLYRINYSDANWISILENELNNSRPIQYAGSGADGGHSWVCDGYNTSGNFHMNWGWGGNLDGFYNLNALNPGGTPLDSDQEALIGIQPAPAVAYFNAYPLVVRTGDTVRFSDNSLGSVPITSWLWSLPGSSVTSSAAQNPAIIYNNPGTYDVSETVTSTKGSNTFTRSGYIVVLPNNTVNVFPTLNDGNFTVQLHDGSLVNSNIEFALYDVMGRKLYTTTLTKYITPMSLSLPHGMYIFRAFDSSNKPVATGKMVMK